MKTDMKEIILKKPHLTAVIKTSGFESPVAWIDLEEKRCKTESGYEADIDEFVFRDSRDYDAMRGEFAGRAMQAMIGALTGDLEIAKAWITVSRKNGFDHVSKNIAADAVRYADTLIAELKRPMDYKEIFGL